MATAPVSRRLNLTRDQLASFLTDQQQIRQFELLLTAIDALAGQIVSAGQVYAGPPTGSGLPSFRALQKSDLPASALTDLDDVDVTAVVDGQLLRYDEPTQKWVNSEGFTVDAIGRTSTTDTLSVESNGSGTGAYVLVNGDEGGAFLLLTYEAISELAEISFVDSALNVTAPKINITSYSDISLAAGGVDCFLLSPVNGFLSLSVGSPPAPTAQLDINNNTIRLRNNRTPASATATGNKGDICWDTNYIYVCVATNTWKRTAISTW